MAKKTFWEMFNKVVRKVWLTNTFNDWLDETESIKEDINDIQKEVLSISKSYLTKAWVLISWWTVATQNNYTIPTTVDKITTVKITSNSINYYPKKVSITEFHTFDNTNTDSDIPVIWTIDKTELYIYPTPVTSSLPIELNSNEFATDLETSPSVTTDQTTALEIKESFSNVIYYYALNEAYERLEDFASADRQLVKYEKIMKKYVDDVSNPTNDITIWWKGRIINPNYNPILTN